MKAVIWQAALWAGLALAASAEDAPSPFYEELARDQSWTGIRIADDDAALPCVIFARPSGSMFVEENALDMVPRGERVSYISWPLGEVQGGSGQVSFEIGFALASTSAEPPLLVIDGQTGYQLLAQGGKAFTQPQDDEDIREAMRRGSEMFVQSKLENGQIVRDTYSLIGVQAITQKMATACK